jgi:two-component system, OmpR family, response regulator
VPRICRVLIVEDDGAVRGLLEQVFDAEGYRFAIAENGAEMRRAIAEGDVDVVIIDVLLRGENGLDLAEEAAASGCAVVLTTGDHTYEKRIGESGHKFILKPYRLSALLDVVRAALDAVRNKCETKSRELDGGIASA